MSTNDVRTTSSESAADSSSDGDTPNGGANAAVGAVFGAAGAGLGELAAAVRDLAEAIRSSAMTVPIEYEIVPCDGQAATQSEDSDASTGVEPKHAAASPCGCAGEQARVEAPRGAALPVVSVPSPAGPSDDPAPSPCEGPHRGACGQGTSQSGPKVGRHRRPEADATPTSVAAS